jgi:hypothetical protein
MLENRTLYEQGDFPIFQNRMYESAQAALECPRGDIRLVQDSRSGLIFNAAFKPELMTYDAAYQNEQAHSPSFRTHLETVADIIENALGRQNLVEVGCGKAFFLELLQARGCSITGFDPTYEGNNPSIERHLFESGVSVKASGIVLRHVLEHVQDPFSFLSGLRDTNDGGLIYIEVPCLDWILRRRAWFDIFYEHVNYFRLLDFHRMFDRVIASGRLFGGQYLYVVADLALLRTPVATPDDEITFPADFLYAVLSEAGSTIGDSEAVWGAASKGVIYSLLRARRGNPVKQLIDINPAKIGRFVPGTGLRVLSPEEGLSLIRPGSTIRVMNSNYVEEIRQMTGDRFRLEGVERE